MIRAVSFDVWNTLLSLDAMFTVFTRGLSEVIGAPLDRVREALLSSYREAKSARRMGRIEENPVTYSQKLLASRLGVEHDDVKRGAARALLYVDKELLFPDTLPALEKLRSKGFTLGVVGNTLFWPGSYTRFILEKLGLGHFLKVQLYADEVGVSKPDKRIFLRFCSAVSVDPGEAVHVGDGVVEDVAGALSASMRAIRIDRGAQRRIVVKEIGLAVVKSLEELPEVLEELV
ncbi:MAG: HAD family hydrolase [Thermoprotei archaeon]|nr:MAG: HAD family hydrolase [Thermoprotei archaeon]